MSDRLKVEKSCICIIKLKPNKTPAIEKGLLGFRQSCDLRFYISILGSRSTANAEVLVDDAILVLGSLKWTATFLSSCLRLYVAAHLLRQHSHPLGGFAVLRAVGLPWWFPLGKYAHSPLLESSTQHSRGACVNSGTSQCIHGVGSTQPDWKSPSC